MATIRAVVVDPGAPGRRAIGTVAAPTPAAGEAIVRVAATSLNRGEVNRAQSAEVGTRIGWDVAGVIERAAADGSGPREGARVVDFLPTAAWAEVVAVPTHALATLPEGVSFAQAATLPVAGLTALHAVEKGGGLLGRNVLITGASGGVGPVCVAPARIAADRPVSIARATYFGVTVRGVACVPEVTARGDALQYGACQW